MPRLSILIPCQGNVAALEQTLVSVLENRPEDCEVLVALNCSYDDPYELVDEVRFIESPADSSLAATINAALRRCHAPIVHLLSAGALAAPDWVEPALALFDDPIVACASPAIVDADGSARTRSCGVRRFASGRYSRRSGADSTHLVGPALAAAFYRRDALLSLAGPFDEQLPDELLDVDAALRIAANGGAFAVAAESRVAASIDVQAPVDAVEYGRQLERQFWRQAKRGGLCRSLAAHAGLVLGELFAGAIRPALLKRVGGRTIGALDALLRRRAPAASPGSVTVVLRNGDRIRVDRPTAKAGPAGARRLHNHESHAA